MSKMLQKIFSLKSTGIDAKILQIFGVKVKFKTKSSYCKYKRLPIERNKIVFSNFKGSDFGCNPKYIAEEIIKRNLPYDLCWLVQKEKMNSQAFPSNIKLVDYYSNEAIKELATAKVWIDNQRKNSHLKYGLDKREGQIYIQTWHGSLGIKKLDNDVKAFTDVSKRDWLNTSKKDSSFTDYLITNSIFENEILPKALWFKNKILKIGHPRNDIFFKLEQEKSLIKNKVYNALSIGKDKKILLYVPSFRDDKSLNCYGINTIEVLKKIQQRFKDNWIFVVRMHPRLKNESIKLFEFGQYVIDATDYSDIQELLVSADIAITDYSSCIFDFMLSKKPAFIYAEDIEKYNTERGFYYSLESTPFPVARNNEELVNNILNFDNEKYQKEVEEFLQEKGCMEDGHASERIVDLIEGIINE